MIGRICVYCGSGAGTDPAFEECARALGSLMAQAGIGLVYGGGNVGLMGSVARAVFEGGGHVTGIIPEFLLRKEIPGGAQAALPISELIITADMHERKRLMFERSDAFVALPGGVGTLEELIEQMTWAQLGRHGKPILMLSVKGFWKPLLVLLAHMREYGFIRDGFEVHTLVAEKVGDVIPMLDSALRHGARPREGALPPL